MRIVDENCLNRFRFARKCEWCAAPTPHGAHPHHIYCRGAGSGGRLDIAINLIALDWKCHGMVHSGHIQRHDLLAIVAARHGVTQDAIKAIIRDLRHLDKNAPHSEVNAILVRVGQ